MSEKYVMFMLGWGWSQMFRTYQKQSVEGSKRKLNWHMAMVGVDSLKHMSSKGWSMLFVQIKSYLSSDPYK